MQKKIYIHIEVKKNHTPSNWQSHFCNITKSIKDPLAEESKKIVIEKVNKGPHEFKISCGECGKYIKWLPGIKCRPEDIYYLNYINNVPLTFHEDLGFDDYTPSNILFTTNQANFYHKIKTEHKDLFDKIEKWFIEFPIDDVLDCVVKGTLDILTYIDIVCKQKKIMPFSKMATGTCVELSLLD
jgi:hypothetical protein